jgi:uracil-DNA glycosylase
MYSNVDMSKQTELDTLKDEISENISLPLREANLVFGEGNPDCSVMFIGEAPGLNEDKQGRPFVGRAGKLLDELIEGINWKRSDVYITNIVKRRPPENRDPFPEEIEAYKPYLKRQIDIINPPIIATLGRFSMNYFLPLAKISRDRGKVFMHEGRKIFPLYHPAAALRSTSVLEELKKDFAKLPDVASGKNLATLPPLHAPLSAPTNTQPKLF